MNDVDRLIVEKTELRSLVRAIVLRLVSRELPVERVLRILDSARNDYLVEDPSEVHGLDAVVEALVEPLFATCDQIAEEKIAAVAES